MNFDTLKRELQELENARVDTAWPAKELGLLKEAGCLRAVVPRRLGGDQVDPTRQLEGYEAVAGGSVTMALILTQHDGACELLADCDNPGLAQNVLSAVSRGDALATVGISQLTTSRHRGPAPMQAERDGDDFVLSGIMPWVTSAQEADYIVTGAVLDDGQQVLACTATGTEGLRINEPMSLMALSHSLTTAVRCEGVRVSPGELMRGPMERVLALRAPVKPLSVSAVGVGLAGALLEIIQENGKKLGEDFVDVIRGAEVEFAAVRKRLYNAADALSDPEAEIQSMDIRVAVNTLVMRLAATCLTCVKGSGYLLTHPAQRLAREAMFFLVWSAPPHVQLGTLQEVWM